MNKNGDLKGKEKTVEFGNKQCKGVPNARDP
jgi:hypothetical protein